MPEWKPIALEGDVFENNAFGLIGIEELLPDDPATPKSENKKGKKRKSKPSSSTEGSPKKLKISKEVEKQKGLKKLKGVKTEENKSKTNLKAKKIPKKLKNTNKLKNSTSVVRKPFNSNNLKFLNHMGAWSKYSVPNEVLKALHDKGYKNPTDIQLKSLGSAMFGRDILACAETGSGKTLVFAIPIVSGILNYQRKFKEKDEESAEEDELMDDTPVDEEDWESQELDGVGCVKVQNIIQKQKKSKLLALVLAPTRELAVQVKKHIEDLCVYTNLRVALVVGGLAHEKQERLLSKNPEIVVATPGRLWELITNGNEHLQTVNAVRYLAVDETDRMLERGHFEELGKLLERINFSAKQRSRRQNFVLSATLSMVHDPPQYVNAKKRKRVTPGQKLQTLMDKIGITDAKVVDITGSKVTAENLIENKIVCEFEEKDYYLYHFLKENEGRTIVFCNSIGCVKRLANLLNILELRPLPIHASMEQKQRLRNLDKFRNCSEGILLATDVAARGLDIPGVDHVVHYQVPRSAESYVHRSGRTARAGLYGSALLLIDTSEHSMYIRLTQTLGRDKEIDDLDLNTDTLKHVKKIVHLARDIDQLTLALKRDSSKQSWYQKAIKEMDIVLDEDEIPKAVSNKAEKKMKRDLSIKQKELKFLINQPGLPKGFCGKFPDMNTCRKIAHDQRKIPGAFVLKKPPVQ